MKMLKRLAVVLLVFALPCGRSRGQTLTNLYSFTGLDDGNVPLAGLIQASDGNFYGTTTSGGYVLANVIGSGYGTIFRISTNGDLTRVYAFNGAYYDNDGDNPQGVLVQGRDGNFYGTTFYGGTGYDGGGCNSGCGTVFRVSPSGNETNLHLFHAYQDGAYPTAGLVQGYDGNFYGTTSSGGTICCVSYGTIFRISPGGVFTTLYSFSNSPSDGALPSQQGLVQGSDSNFYGTTQGVGWWTGKATGTVFRVSPSGEFSNLYSFVGITNGYLPIGGLVQGVDGNFYGATSYGGNTNLNNGFGYGTIFRISSSGSFTNIWMFSQGDGSNPSELVLGSDGNFYGVTGGGGAYSNGVVFRITSSGSLTVLQSITLNSGRNGLMQGSDGNFYGTTQQGGIYSNGAVFQFAIPLSHPANQISIFRPDSSGTNLIFGIPSVAGETYQLQFSADIASGIWSNIPNVSVTNSLGALLTLTNFGGGSSPQGFYRFDITP